VVETGFLSGGIVFLAGFFEDSAHGSLFTLTSADPQPAPLNGTLSYAEGKVSPNSKWLIYNHIEDKQSENMRVVMSADGQMLATMPWIDEWGTLSGWLDNERVLFKNRTISPPAVTFTILDPFTLVQTTISPDMPDLFIKDPTSNFIGWNAVIDPTLTRIVYIRQHYDPWERDLVLRDLEAGRELWSLEKYSTEFIQPVWSPDGDQLAIVAMNREEDDWNRFELTISSRDGELNQWVDIQGYYPEVGRGQLSWSPNGSYLAFSIWAGGFPVLILDVENRQLLDYCIPGGATYSNVIWSPDSTQMIIPRQEEPFIVVDLERNLAAKIVQDPDLIPVGWLTEEKP
jgi:dipeptidyl aminopeptidase/acylaminoacyl peptidase